MFETRDISHKTVVITGATSGIGLEAASSFAKGGAYVIGVGRSPERCQEAKGKILAACPSARVDYLLADLSVQGQVRQLAQQIRQTLHQAGFQALDVLVNNAGTYSAKFTRTPDGVEYTFAVNHLAPFLLTHELLPLLVAAPQGRILTVSSSSHFNTWLDLHLVSRPFPYVGLWAYKVSKLANALFAHELDHRLKGTPARSFAVDPGLVNTEIGLKSTDWLSRAVWQLRRRAGTSPQAPVQTLLHLASAPEVQTSREIYWYDSHPFACSRQARRADLAQALWAESLRLCGLSA